MRIVVDGEPVDTDARTVGDLLSGFPEGSDALVDGRHVPREHPLAEGDQVTVMSGARSLDSATTGDILPPRYGRETYDRIRSVRVGIAGLGGIGSHVAASLVRAGVSDLVIVDMDAVDRTNLNRQNYTYDDIGRSKAEATADTLLRIDPDIRVEWHHVRVDADNCADLFSGCGIVCEAFDDPSAKAMLVETLLTDTDSTVVSCSGMAGFDSCNGIGTVRRMSRLYVCGDGVSDSSSGAGLVAPRVMVCAGHMAHTVIRLAVGFTDP
ncbi:MAG: sulfur carrier protein ThiS adenylyltransferase ThiF [Candidatus Methanomethylophilaceae archaeon]|nr:sulfur carrier protein ThiS adenylyltransferase ThiF [Candidatus Methanomethylophilaceae archaeon]